MKRLFVAAALAAVSGPALAQAAPTPPTVAQKPYTVKGPLDRNDPYYWLRDDTRKNPDMLAYLAGRERLCRRGAGADQAAAGRIVQGDRRPHQAGRFERAVRERGYLLLHALRRRGRIIRCSRARPACLSARSSHARRAGDGQGPRLLRGRRLDRQPEQPPARLCRSIPSAAPVRAQGQGPRDRQDPRRRGRQRRAGPGLGRRQPDPLLHREGPGHPAHQAGEGARARHAGLGRPLVYEETDDSFYMGVGRTSDDKYICIDAAEHGQRRAALHRAAAARQADSRCWRRASTTSATRPTTSAAAGSIRTNWNANELQAARSPTPTCRSGARRAGPTWCRTTPTCSSRISSPSTASSRSRSAAAGCKRIRLLSNSGKSSDVRPRRRAGLRDGARRQSASPTPTRLRYTYNSLTTPHDHLRSRLRTGERTLLKRSPCRGYDPSQYVTERVWATARDGTKVPVSLVYKKGFKRDGTAAMLQYGYGSYGASTDPRIRRRPSCACSTAAWSTRSRTSAAARRWAAPGTTHGHLLNKKNTLHRFHRRHPLPGRARAMPRRTGSPRRAAAPAAC